MKIRLVQKFEAFDCVYMPQKNPSTAMSLSLDGRRYYSLAFPGKLTPSSGEKVAVAFKDEAENKIVGWIDPVSKQFHSIYASSESIVLMASLMSIFLSILAFAILYSLRVPLLISIAAVGGILWFVISLGIKDDRFRRNLEASLRDLQKAHDTAPD